MAKRSQRRTRRYEEDQAGCIWGLISIFDFRNGRSTHRLLSDRRRGIRQGVGGGYSRSKPNKLANFDEKSQGIYDDEESETVEGNAGKTSVKELMEEEMFNEQDPKKQVSAEVDARVSDSKHKGCVKKSRKPTKKTSKRSCDMHACDLNATKNLGPQNSCHEVSEQKTSNNIDLEVIVEELYHQIHQKSTRCVKHDLHEDLDVQPNQTYSIFEEKLREAIKVFVNQKSTDGKKLKEFVDALHTLSSNKELFLKLLKDPNSLLGKHIQDSEDAMLEREPNSKSVRRSNLLDEEQSNSRPSSELVHHKQHYFFRRKSKSWERKLLKGNENCPPSNRIVILKPGPAGTRNSKTESNISSSLQSHYSLGDKGKSERTASQFSFTEIKRKLKHAMGKEQNMIISGDITHRFPYEHQDLGNSDKRVGAETGRWGSPISNHFYNNERFARPSTGIKKGDKIAKPEDTETSMGNGTVGYPEQRVSNIYAEAKKHLLEMLSNGDEIEDFSSGQLPKTLGRILSLPEFNFSPICSPGRDEEHCFVTAQMRLSSYNNFHMVDENMQQLIQENHASHLISSRQSLEGQSCIPDDNPNDEEQEPNSNHNGLNELNHANAVEETSCSMRDEMNSEADAEIVITTGTVFPGYSQALEVSAEASSNRDDQGTETAEVCEEEKSAQCLKLDLFEEDQSLSSPFTSPSSSSIIKKVEDLERPERPSPISVLEPLFTEDDISPASTKSLPVEPRMQPLQIHLEGQVFSAGDQGICVRVCLEDEESTFEYVEAVLLGSGLNWDEFLLRWLSSEQLLDPSLFDEVELFSNRSFHDQKVLFDCTNEVLEEVCERYFGCSPWVSFVKQNIRPVPKGKNLIREVWEGVEWHLLLQPPPRTLDQIVRKDMEKTGKWMDLRVDTEIIGVEIGEDILDNLMEDTILSFVNEHLESEFSVLPVDFKESESSINL